MSYHNSTTKQVVHVNVLDDVVTSGVLAVLTPRQGQILLMLAGYAHRDTRLHKYRQSFCYQGDWAKKMGCSRRTVNGALRAMESAGVIAYMGKHRMGGQSCNVYMIAEFDDLISIAAKQVATKRHGNTDGLLKGRKGVRPVSHLSEQEVRSQDHTLMGSSTHTLQEKVGNSTLTERDVVFERKEERDFDISPSLTRGENSTPNTNGSEPPEFRDLEVEDDPEVLAQKQAIKERLEALLEAAEVGISERNAVFIHVSEVAREGQTLEERNRLALAAVEQLEFQFEQQQAEAVQP